MNGDLVAERNARISELMQERLGIRGSDLETKLRKAQRLMPRWVYRDARTLVEAQRLMGHPKLMMQTDPTSLERSFQTCESWLKSVDPKERRKDKILGLLAVNAFNLLMVGALFVAALKLTGHV